MFTKVLPKHTQEVLVKLNNSKLLDYSRVGHSEPIRLRSGQARVEKSLKQPNHGLFFYFNSYLLMWFRLGFSCKFIIYMLRL